MQEEIDMYVTNDKLDNARVRCKLDPFYKNILQKYFELVFKDISISDENNPIIEDLLLEIERENKLQNQ